ncbi:MAG: glycosyltransferase family 39 protein [bacterium]
MRVVRHLSWLLPLAFGVALLSRDIAEPWVGSYDANGALFSTAARNYLRYGLVATRGGQVTNAGQLTPDRFRFYSHHPPGISLTLAASFALFGETEWAARLVPITFTLAATALLYLVARELAGRWAGLFAALMFVAQPMVAFYGRMPDHEAPGACFAVLLTWLYLRWAEDRRRGWLIAMAVAGFVGLWYAWVVFVVPWALLGCQALTERRGWKALVLPTAAAVAGFAAVAGHVAVVEGGLGELWEALLFRLGSQASDISAARRFGLGEWALRQGAYLSVGFVPTVLVGVLFPWGLGERRRRGTLLVAALVGFALFNLVVFRQGAYVHLYYQFYLAVPLALASGLALWGMWRRARRRRWSAGIAVLLAALTVAVGWAKLGRIHAASFYQAQLEAAEGVRAESRPGDRVHVLWRLRPRSWRQLVWYADRDIAVTRVSGRAEALRAAEGLAPPVFHVFRDPTGELVVEKLTGRQGGGRPGARGR